MKTLRILQLLVIIAVAISITSCESCIEGNGIITTENRIVVGDFDGIEVDGSFEVYFVQDSMVSIEVEGDGNLLSYVTTAVKNHTLVIDQTNRCFRIDDPIRVYVSAPDVLSVELDGSGIIDCEDIYQPGERFTIRLDGSGHIEVYGLIADFIDVDLGGSGDIYVQNIQSEFLDGNISGSGSIDLRGETVESELSISGSGNIKAFRLDQEDCDAQISGSGSIYVFVYDNLWVDVSGSGYIHYRGDPDIHLSDSDDYHYVKNDNF